MIRRFATSFHPRAMPLMTRHSYRQDMVNSGLVTIGSTLMEAGFVGVLAKKAFGVSDMVLAVIAAAPMFANLTSLMWAKLSRGRPKVAFICGLQVGALLCVGAVGLLPTRAPYDWALVALVVISRFLMAAILTVRSTVWRSNYPRHARGHITSRLALVGTITTIGTTLVGGWLLDAIPLSFHVFYPLAMLIGSVGVVAYSRIRLRGEKELLAFERRENVQPQRHGEGDGIYEYDPDTPDVGFWSVLRNDPMFRGYQTWQFIMGASNMMHIPIFIALVARMTDGQPNDYLISTALTLAIPMALSMISLPIWAKLLDNTHVIRFRVRHGFFWTSSLLLTWLGAEYESLTLLACSRVLIGISMGGGMLAWQLGHNDFASRRMAAIYMGVHVMLAGVRGAFAPFLGIVLYNGWQRYAIGGMELAAFGGVGNWTFALCAVGAGVATVGFMVLERARQRRLAARAPAA
jgi:MFS family permease